MCRAGMGDHQRPPSEPQRVARGHRPVGHIGELEPAHGVEAHHPDPVGNQGVLSAFGGQRPAVGMGDDLGPGPAEHDGAEVMVGVVVGEDEPADRL